MRQLQLLETHHKVRLCPHHRVRLCLQDSAEECESQVGDHQQLGKIQTL